MKLSLLFTTTSGDISPIPEKNKYILGISSLWILTILRNSLILLNPYLVLIIFSISIISPLFWYKYQINSLLHKLDKLLVWIIVIINLKYAIYKLYILFLLIIYFFYLSEFFIIKRKFKHQLISHLLFRYFFFIWIYLTYYNTLLQLSLISFGYLLHNIYLIKIIFYLI
jgi:hypothetical protein